MLNTIEIYFLLFITYSVLGWTLEVVGKLIEIKKFVNRGFLVGPCCAIYGVGGLLITFCLQKLSFNVLLIFIASILLCGTLEYITSYLMEKLFNARWWDYSQRKFNIQGRVCLFTIIPFGILGCFIIYIANPFFLSILNNLSSIKLHILSGTILAIFIVDYIVSFTVMLKLRKTASLVNEENREDNTEEITKKVKDILFGKSILNKRIFEAYPRLKAIKIKITKQTNKIKQSVNDAKIELKENITEKKENIKESFENTKNNIKNIGRKK